jgi:hypothetical protein
VVPRSRSSPICRHMSRRSSTSTPAVGSSRNKQLGIVAQRLGDHHPALHPARQLTELAGALVPQPERAQDFLDPLGAGRTAEHPARKGDGAVDPREHVEAELLRHQADARPQLAPVLRHVLAEGADGPGGRADEAADRADQRRLAGAVGAEQGEDLAAADLRSTRRGPRCPRRTSCSARGCRGSVRSPRVCCGRPRPCPAAIGSGGNPVAMKAGRHPVRNVHRSLPLVP